MADAYDVMTAARSYRKPVTAGAAREELTACAGSQFDPAVVRAFLNVAVARLMWLMGPLGLLAPLPAVRHVVTRGRNQGGAVATATALAGLALLGWLPLPELSGHQTPDPVTDAATQDTTDLERHDEHVLDEEMRSHVADEDEPVTPSPDPAPDVTTPSSPDLAPAGVGAGSPGPRRPDPSRRAPPTEITAPYDGVLFGEQVAGSNASTP